MKKISKEDYRNNIAKMFTNHQDYYYEKVFDINKFQKCHHFTEFKDINNMSFNKIMEGARYLNNKGIDYYNPEPNNIFRTLMLAWEDYVNEYNNNAMNEFITYIDKSDVIFENTKKTTLFKLFMLDSSIAKFILIKNNFFEKRYLGIQKYVRRYYELRNEIDDLNPENDIESAVIFYMNSLMNDMNKEEYPEDIDLIQNEVNKYKLFHQHVDNMCKALEFIGKTERLDEITEFEQVIMKEDLERNPVFKRKEKKLTSR